MNGHGCEVDVSGQRKKVILLCILLVAGGGWVALASRHGGQRAQAAVQPADPNASFLGDPNQFSPADINLGKGELFLKMMLSVGLVIGLGIAALYVSKRVLPKVANAPGKEIHIRETAYLGPRKALHLVEIGGHRLLIASTDQSITTLAHVTDAWLDISRQEIDDPVKL